LARIRILPISHKLPILLRLIPCHAFPVDHFWRARRHCRLLQLSQKNLLRKPIAEQTSHKFASFIHSLSLSAEVVRVNLNLGLGNLFVNMFQYGSFPDEDMELF
jgi:hypothetical protein